MRSSTEKIYFQLKHEFETDYGVDVLLPTECELCRRFSVGRSAIRSVLARLEQEGIIRSRGFHGARQVAEKHRTFK